MKEHLLQVCYNCFVAADLSHCCTYFVFIFVSGMSICLMLFVNVSRLDAKLVITMGRSSFLQSTPLNLQESGFMDFGCFSFPQNFNWCLFSPFLFFLTFLNVAFTESNCSFCVAWLLQMVGLWRKRRSAYPWVIVSAIKFYQPGNHLISLITDFLSCDILQFIQKVGIRCGLYQGIKLHYWWIMKYRYIL